MKVFLEKNIITPFNLSSDNLVEEEVVEVAAPKVVVTEATLSLEGEKNI